ncbi:MAG: C39 family peptidase [Patescibacteria group bacterium]
MRIPSKNWLGLVVSLIILFSFMTPIRAHSQISSIFVSSGGFSIDTTQQRATFDLKAIVNEDIYSLSVTQQNKVTDFKVNDMVGKYLDVPYFNQCLQSDKKTFFPDNIKFEDKEACRYMCSAATMVMIGGYFDKLDYDPSDTDTLKKYMYSDNGQGVSDTCGQNQGGAFGLIAKETDRITGGITECNQGSREGMRKYGTTLDLFTDYIDPEIKSIKEAIDRENPVILSNGPHIWVVKGYFEDKLIVNDPYRNGEEKGEDYNYKGQNAIYTLPEIYYKDEFKPMIYAVEVSDRVLTKAELKKGDQIESSATIGLSVRPEVCGSSRSGQAQPGEKGTIIAEPKIVEACALGYDFKVWYKIKWENGLEGWSVGNFIQIPNE